MKKRILLALVAGLVVSATGYAAYRYHQKQQWNAAYGEALDAFKRAYDTALQVSKSRLGVYHFQCTRSPLDYETRISTQLPTSSRKRMRDTIPSSKFLR